MPMMSLKLGRSWGSLKHCTIRLRSTAGCMSSVMGNCLLAQPTAPTTCSRQTGSCSAQGCDSCSVQGPEVCQTGLLGGQASTQAEWWLQPPLDTQPAAYNVLGFSTVQASTATAERVLALPECQLTCMGVMSPQGSLFVISSHRITCRRTPTLLSAVEAVLCRLFPDSGASRHHLLIPVQESHR